MPLRLRPGVVLVDKHESRSGIPEHLTSLGASVRLTHLEVGDYMLPGDILVERKTVRDFVSSLLDGRLFEQAVNLSSSSKNPTILIEGDWREVLAESGVREEALWGALASLGYDFKLTILHTPGPLETAKLLYVVSRRTEGEEIRVKPKRKKGGLEELQVEVVSSLPGVGPTRARRLLENLGSVRAVFNADPGQLSRAGGIPYEISLAIHRLINTRYGEPPPRDSQRRINHF